METQYFKFYSPALNRDMECKVYGHAGRPVLFIPCQDGRFFDFENYKMADVWSPWIESGQVMVFSIDTIEREANCFVSELLIPKESIYELNNNYHVTSLHNTPVELVRLKHCSKEGLF